MKVLHITAGRLFGGVETLLVTLARCRDMCREMEPEFALCFDGRLGEELRNTGAPVHMLGNTRIRNPLSIRRARKALANLIESRGFEIVVCHMEWSQAIFGMVAREAGLPLVFWLHNASSGKRLVERLASRVPPDLVICNSKFTTQFVPLIYRGIPFKIVYYPVQLHIAPSWPGLRSDIRREFDTPQEAVVLIQMSRLDKWKGHYILLDALARLDDTPNWVCWMVGGPQRSKERRYFEKLKHRAKQKGLSERIRFAGERSDVPRILAGADIHCQANTGPESFGIVFIEALDAGLPVVTSAIGGALDIVDPSCGLLVQPGDPAALAAALRPLIEDESERVRLGVCGPARAKDLCDPRTSIERLCTILAELCEPRGVRQLAL
jgi:glycosyltransferase involved in cell wall biosynthesis